MAEPSLPEESIFLEALEIPSAAERAAYLDRACGENCQLRAAVEALLDANGKSGDLLDLPEKPAVTIEVEHSLSFLQPSEKSESLGRLGHYEILELIGRGGMGIVLRAFDDKLHRVVAIKVIAPQLAASSPPRKRFLREARAAAAIRHEHVVDIHAVEEEPIPYLVMEYVPGENLQQKLDRVGPLELPEVLRFGRQIACGLAAAHARGLIHRDIKPANILLESGVDQHVKITDFGLARAADDASLTQSGMIAGTPMYMAPEQTQGETTDHRADLFSLGSVMYTMCSGRPPFRASTSLAVLKRVAEDTPRPIREIIPEVPQWACDIIARLHAKKPEDRYQSAAEVADLLGRCLAELQQQGQVISVGQAAGMPEKERGERRDTKGEAKADVRPQVQPGALPRGKRRWGLAAAVALLLLGGLSFTEATGVTNVRASVIRIFTGDGTLIVEVNDPGVKVTIEGDGGLVITGAGPQEVRLRPGSYKLQAAKDGKPIRLDQELVTITRGDKLVVRVAVEPKGLADASAGLPESDEIRRFEGQSGAIYDVAYSPKESIVAAACHDECIRLWDADSGKLIRILEGHTNLVSGVAFSTDGKQIVSSSYDGTVRLWNLATGKQVRRLETGAAELHSVALSEDATLALCGGVANRPGVMGTIQLWDLKNGKRIPGFGDVPSTHVYRVAISPDGRTALSGGNDSVVRLWDMASGKQLQQLPHPAPVNPAFSSDGQRALSSSDDKIIRLWNWEQGKLVLAGHLRGHTSSVNRAVFSPNGRQVISSSADNTMRLWDVESGKELHRFVGHTEGVRGLVFSPDGRYLVSGSLVDGSVRLWKVPEPGDSGKWADTAAPTLVAPWNDSDDWVVEGRELVQPNDRPGVHHLLFGDPNWTDYNFEAEVEIIAGGIEVGLMFRVAGLGDRLNAVLFPATKGIRENGGHGVLAVSRGGSFIGILSVVPGQVTLVDDAGSYEG